MSLLYIGFTHYQMQKHKNNNPTSGADYMIVLGARVHGTEPSLSLQYRINTAADYLLKSPNTIAIVSGGQGVNEDISEAQVMKDGLIALGVDRQRIIKEDQSTSTYENIKFSKKLIKDSAKRIIVVTNDYHLYRSILIGNQYGLDLEALPAKTPKQALLKSYAREYLALIKYYLLSMTNQIN
ncbi:YdcF family protein [Bacillus massiliigorillae]|uniref:YdcF family protein n=1 Tax=Bacillus massiliigorillae TaxID=1243664 RepID=UPI0005A7DD64|nr:YdcF family protein [Bacillus massiliigorillae]